MAKSIRETNRNFKYVLNKRGRKELYLLPDEDVNLIKDLSVKEALIKNKLKDNLESWLESATIIQKLPIIKISVKSNMHIVFSYLRFSKWLNV